MIGIGRYPDQRFVETREKVQEIADKFVSNQVDAYFGCAKFGAANNRTHSNAKYFKALWMDVDCGAEKAVPDENGIIKGYVDQPTGLAEFQKFCKAVGLRQPIIVDSGNGWHVYWLLDETLEQNAWRPLARALRDKCVEHGLIIDPSAFEASRVLRIPGTFNFKDKSNPKPVTVMNEHTTAYTYEEIKELLGADDPDTDFIPRRLSPLMESMLSNRVKRFSTIMIKSAKGEGCQQLLHCYEHQESIGYDLWRSALSIAAFCVDKDKAIHEMSKDHPDYDEGKTQIKADDIGGPHLCKTFERWNPGGCDGCKHKGVLSTPILLGNEIAKADEADNIVAVEDDAGVVSNVTIPPYPEPYFRGKHGGVYKRVENDDGEADAQLVYEHDLYTVKRMFDKEVGEVVLFRLHLPHDGVKEFTVPLTSVMAKEKLRESLGYHGVVALGKQQDALTYYIAAFVKNLQVTNKAEIMRTQFGWAEKDSIFIVGDREITKDGTFYSPPSTTTRDEAELLTPAGTFEKWKEVFNLYGQPGLEPHAFAALTAFGAPLLRFTGLSGAIINLIHQSSGSGKSTALFMCNSVWGHPKKMANIWKDTQASKLHRLGVFNNLPNTIDEITNLSPMEFSDLAYSISQGRGKNRMKSSSNEMRVNNTTWQNMTLASSNASFYQKLGAAKDSPDGESMRLLEYEVRPTNVISVAVGKAMFDKQLFENYGHAGDIYAAYLVSHLEEVKDLIAEVQAKLDREVQFTTRERFWSGVAACNIVGGLIAKSLGLHDYDMRAIYKWLIGMLQEMREEIKPPQSNPLTIVGEFLNANMSNALVVNDEIDARSSLVPLPTLEPRGELRVRYEPDTKHLYITVKQFREFCVRAQINYKDLLKDLDKAGVYKGTVNKRMAKGMKMVSPAVRALLFDTTKSEFLQVDTYLEGQDEDREGSVQD